ncbi:MAG: type I methionyl aminopeptidase [Fidelibacterota bacterium]
MINIRSKREIEIIRECGFIVCETLDMLAEKIKPGITTKELDEMAADFIYSRGGRPAFYGFHGYPANICVSIDSEVVHGIPGKKRLEEGQIVSIDIGVKKDGYFGDSARTFAVGDISFEKRRLIEITKQALNAGIERAVEGSRLLDISNSIQNFVESNRFSVVRELVGHGIGSELHEEPRIPNFGPANRGPLLKSGMVFAIEPMVNAGSHEVFTASDGWTVKTSDGSASAHFEHTVVITANGPLVLTENEIEFPIEEMIG